MKGVGVRCATLLGLLVGLLLASFLQWAAEDHDEVRQRAQTREPRRRHIAQLGQHRHRASRRRHKHHRKESQSLPLPPPPPSPLPAPFVPWMPRPCLLNCSGFGVCNHDTGECLCPMGRDGAGCERADEFPCNLPHGEQLVARCSGVCNLETSKCSCGGGRFPQRSMHKCVFKGIQPYMKWDGPGWDYETVAQTPAAFWSSASDAPAYLRRHEAWSTPSAPLPGKAVAWCDASPERVAKGLERPMVGCRCEEGTTGRLCEITVLHACLNQCNGHGTCRYGYCVCDPEWYGVDCSLWRGRISLALPGDVAGGAAGGVTGGGVAGGGVAGDDARLSDLPSAAASGKPPTSVAPAARQCHRPRPEGVPYPAIYLYELPIEFNLRLWTSKSRDEDCALRAYTRGNTTDWKQHAFGMEVGARIAARGFAAPPSQPHALAHVHPRASAARAHVRTRAHGPPPRVARHA